MHLDDEQLQRLLHGELAGAGAGTVQAHLDECASCHALVATAEREEARVFDLLRRLDDPVPAVDPHSLIRGIGRQPAPWVRWAAGIVLALAVAGVAYAAPGSPVPAWVRRVVAWLATPGPAPGPQAPGAVAGPSGIALDPGRRLTIVFAAPHAEGQATVALTDESQVVVRSRDVTARFNAEVERLVVSPGDLLAVYEVEIPRDAPFVEIRLGERRLLLKEGARVVTDAALDAGGGYVLRLQPAPAPP